MQHESVKKFVPHVVRLSGAGQPPKQIWNGLREQSEGRGLGCCCGSWVGGGGYMVWTVHWCQGRESMAFPASFPDVDKRGHRWCEIWRLSAVRVEPGSGLYLHICSEICFLGQSLRCCHNKGNTETMNKSWSTHMQYSAVRKNKYNRVSLWALIGEDVYDVLSS